MMMVFRSDSNNLTQRPVFPEEGESSQDVWRDGFVFHLQERREPVQHVFVQEVSGEHERQHYEEFQTALGRFLQINTCKESS